jgi:hypothetical protein
MQRSTRKFVHLTLTAVGIALVAVALAATGGGSANATNNTGPSQVLVVNSPNQPIPIASLGTTNVAGTVAVSTMPNITGTMSIDPQNNSVHIVNPTPIGVSTDIAQRAINLDCPVLVFPPASEATVTCSTVPAGKRLVIEYVGASATLPTGESPLFSVKSTANATTNEYPIGSFTTTFLSSSGSNFWQADHVVKIYGDQGTNIVVHFASVGSTGEGALGSIKLSGYLADSP